MKTLRNIFVQKRMIYRHITITLLIIILAGVSQAVANEPAPDDNKLAMQINLGGSAVSGNTESNEARLSLEGGLKSKIYVTEFSTLYQYREKNGAVDQNMMAFKLKELINTKTSWLPFVSYDFVWDKIKGVEYDHNLGVGAKLVLYSVKASELSISGSAIYQIYKNQGEQEQRVSGLGLAPKYIFKLNQTVFSAVASYQADPGNSENYKYNYSFKLTYFLTSMLGLSAEYESRYRNLTSEDAVKLDSSTTLSLTLVF